MSAFQRVILSCDQPGCEEVLTIDAPTIRDARVIAGHVGWAKVVGGGYLNTDVCNTHRLMRGLPRATLR